MTSAKQTRSPPPGEKNRSSRGSAAEERDQEKSMSRARDTFGGRVCECPVTKAVNLVGDGYTHCEASGSGRCEINNGGCWKETRNGWTYFACTDDGCKCPDGFKGDGIHKCEDIDECKERTACQCKECKCKNTWGSYECGCSGGLLYMKKHDTCINKSAGAQVGWNFLWVILFGLAAAGIAGYAVYRATWIQRSAPSWRSTCPWTTRERFIAILTILRCEDNTGSFFQLMERMKRGTNK